MFQFDRDDEGLTVRVTGDAAQAIQEIAEVLELNSQWPIFPIALDNLHRVCSAHRDTEEKLRDIVMLDSNEKQGLFLFDIEHIKVQAKKMEMRGLEGDK